MVEQLFGSKTRVKLLRLFYNNPNRSFYVREITRKINEQINSVRRELSNLLSIGIITSDTTNNRLYYEVNQSFDYYMPLLAIFGAPDLSAQSSDQGRAVRENNPIKDLGNVEVALYTGQFTRDETSGIDILIVGNVNQTKLIKFISELEVSEGKELRYTLISLEEFNYRRQINDRFISNVLNSKHQILIDKHSLVEK